MDRSKCQSLSKWIDRNADHCRIDRLLRMLARLRFAKYVRSVLHWRSAGIYEVCRLLRNGCPPAASLYLTPRRFDAWRRTRPVRNLLTFSKNVPAHGRRDLDLKPIACADWQLWMWTRWCARALSKSRRNIKSSSKRGGSISRQLGFGKFLAWFWHRISTFRWMETKRRSRNSTTQ